MPEYQKMEEFGDSLKQYILLNYDIIKLEVTKKTSEIGSSLLGMLLLGIALFLFVFALSMGVGFYISYLIGDTYSGFLIIAALYLILSIILFIGRQKLIEKPLRDKIIKKLLSDK